MDDFLQLAGLCAIGAVALAVGLGAICLFSVHVLPKLGQLSKRTPSRASLTSSRLESLGLYDEAEALDTLTGSLEERGLYEEAEELRRQADQLADEQEGAIAEMELGDW
jgi:hypothetical protein